MGEHVGRRLRQIVHRGREALFLAACVVLAQEVDQRDQARPAVDAILARDHELGVRQLEGRRRDFGRGLAAQAWVVDGDALQGLRGGGRVALAQGLGALAIRLGIGTWGQ